MSRRSRIGRATSAALLLPAVWSLSGCLGRSGHSADPGWVLDEPTGRWYLEHSDGADTGGLLGEHLPSLGSAVGTVVIEGQFTDPDERVAIPAPDDYWWQAITSLEREEAQDPLERSESTETVSDQELRQLIVEPLDGDLRDCPEGWVDVRPVLSTPGGAPRTAGGDALALAALCPGESQVVISAHDT